MREIKLTRGKVALVDDEDFEFLNQWKWCAHKEHKNGNYYAYRTLNLSKTKKVTIIMHRVIAGLKNSNIHIDHINGNGLDNQRSNIRVCTNAQNLMNKGSYKNNSTGLKGVYSKFGYYVARIRHQGNEVYLGKFNCKTCAAFAFDLAAVKLRGEFARTNF